MQKECARALDAIRGTSNKGLLIASAWMGEELLEMQEVIKKTYDGPGTASECHLSVTRSLHSSIGAF